SDAVAGNDRGQMDTQRRLTSNLGYDCGRARLPSTQRRRIVNGRKSPLIPPIHRPNWFSRNWKWALPGGCLVVLLVGVAFVAAAFFLALGMMKQSDAYKIAVDRAQQNQAVIDALGSPICAGTFVSGSSHGKGPNGDAKLSIPLSGPK